MASVARVTYSSVEVAESYADSLSVFANYGGRLDIADFANELLSQMKERNIALPTSVIASEAFFAHLQRRMHSAVGMGKQGTLFINPAADYWRNPVVYTQATYRARIWSTPHPLHPLIHEIGHLVQEERGTRGKGLTPRERTEAQAVSQRAKDGADEFVAEVFAGLFQGVKYDSEILRAYTRYGGKQP